MPPLAPMPPLSILPGMLASHGVKWQTEQRLDRKDGAAFTRVFENAVASSLSVMLGGAPIEVITSAQLLPPGPNCVEIGPVYVIGGVRPQTFDVGYRPDGLRFVLDVKTLNDTDSIRKNWQNMINDLATEATTVHTRFPYALVSFIVALPAPATPAPQMAAITQTLERLARRLHPDDPPHLAEAISLIMWDPMDGSVSPTDPAPTSDVRYEKFHTFVERAYAARYKGLPPHAA